MKRLVVLLTLCLLLAGVFCLPVSAETAATQVDLQCTVTAEGDCLVTATVNLRLEAALDSLSYPVPPDAKNVTVNGSNATATRYASALQVDLSRISKGYVGDASVRIGYTLPGAVKITTLNQAAVDSGKEKPNRALVLTVPLLSGFEYPVEAMNFTITMPNNCVGLSPSFTSIYRQESIESDLKILPITGSQIIGSTKVVMNDREGVTMTMVVPDKMFPTVSTYVRDGYPELPYILGFFGAALLYWLLTLRTWPIRRSRASTAPEGITAGELGCRLTLTGGDLTMMVFSWAQLGYLLIAVEGNKVYLHKRMDMGNERSLFEVRVFQSLFAGRRVVDCSRAYYAKLCAKTASMVPGEKTMCRPRSGSRKIFRWLLCVSQAFCGMCIAMNMTSIAVLRIMFSLIFGVLSAISAWQIQEFAMHLPFRTRSRAWISLALCLFWVLLGLIAGQPWVPLVSVLVQLLMGYLAAYGGMRTERNRSEAGEILAIRRFLRRIPRPEAARLIKLDPEYFFRMAPYAIALGVGKPFAAAFGRRKLEQCPYLITKGQNSRTAEDWMRLMIQTVALMDDRYRRTQTERWMAIRFR